MNGRRLLMPAAFSEARFVTGCYLQHVYRTRKKLLVILKDVVLCWWTPEGLVPSLMYIM